MQARFEVVVHAVDSKNPVVHVLAQLSHVVVPPADHWPTHGVQVAVPPGVEKPNPAVHWLQPVVVVR